MKRGLKKSEIILLLWAIPLALGAHFSVSVWSRNWLRALSDLQDMHWSFHICVWPLALLAIWLLCGRPERFTYLLWMLAVLWIACFVPFAGIVMSITFIGF